MVEKINFVIKYQKNMITVILFMTIMCWFFSLAKYIGVLFIPVYALLYYRKEKALKYELEKHFEDLHMSEYMSFKENEEKISPLNIDIAPFIKSKYYVKSTFDIHIIEKCDELNKVNLVIMIMILGLSGTILFIS